MDIEEFRRSLAGDEPPAGLGAALAALWWDGRNDWARAHGHAQDDEGAAAAWVHAYLHRREGDLGNAGYWYRRAGKPVASGPLEGEWEAIVRALLPGAAV
jgi:hypothetical protein